MRVVGIDVMPFLVVRCKAFADGVGVGAEGTFKDIVLPFRLRSDIVMLDTVVTSDTFPGGAEVFAQLTFKHRVLVALWDFGNRKVKITDLRDFGHTAAATFSNQIVSSGSCFEYVCSRLVMIFLICILSFSKVPCV